MYSWRVTKYNPLFRNRDGSYQNDEEWTCFSEVGLKVSMEEYVRTEQLYINAISSFMEDIGLDHAYLLALEQWSDEVNKQNAKEFLSKIWVGKTISVQEIQALAGLTLRNAIWCKIGNKKDFYVHFGNDYYMYIGARKDCKKAIDEVTHSGLYVERWESPYQSTS
ncbi:hypothetical protein [Ornithinibacillus sp. JPR2-1]|uniref:hypothetical protein n=1 Tax=Ornithinibacillus sp. JPR2-1 TaxID=2094019 RepID=UPI0031CF3180